MCAIPFPHFHNNLRRLKALQLCGLPLKIAIYAIKAHLDPYLTRTGELTGLRRCKQ